jgi:hypothetical protein
VLRGQTFVGRAFVVNAWYMAAYEPLWDRDHKVIGMFYVGLPEAIATDFLHRVVAGMKVGTSGYVYVLNAVGASRGHYVISQGGKRDGEDIWDTRDSEGAFPIREICRKAVVLNPDEVATHQYNWKNPGDPVPYSKLARLKYFKDWDWVIGVSIPEKELLATQHAIDQIARSGGVTLLIMGLAALAASCCIWFFLAGSAPHWPHCPKADDNFERDLIGCRTRCRNQQPSGEAGSRPGNLQPVNGDIGPGDPACR